MQHYAAYGLTIASDLPLPELREVPEGASADVTISHASLKRPPEGAASNDRYTEHTPDGTYFFWPSLGAFLVSEGCQIQYDLLPEGNEDTLRLPLLGICLGTLLHQRQILTLHASAVALHGRAVAFIGWKGSGKSTTAAALHANGHTLLTDDVLALDPSETPPVVMPAFAQVKLAPSAIAALGGNPDEIPILAPSLTKRALRTGLAFEEKFVPLERIYAVCDGERYASERLTHRSTFLTMLSQTYATRFVGTSGTGEWHFKRLNEVLRHVPVFLLRRPRRLDQLSTLSAFIEDDVLGEA